MNARIFFKSRQLEQRRKRGRAPAHDEVFALMAETSEGAFTKADIVRQLNDLIGERHKPEVEISRPAYRSDMDGNPCNADGSPIRRRNRRREWIDDRGRLILDDEGNPIIIERPGDDEPKAGAPGSADNPIALDGDERPRKGRR